MRTLQRSDLPLPLHRRGKVREVYEVSDEHLLIVASDRVSAFDVVMAESVPHKGAVLTQLSAFWFTELAGISPSHYVTCELSDILVAAPALAEHADEVAGRSMLVRRARPVPFECVVRGYLAGSAWQEYKAHRTLAGENMPADLVESAKLPSPLFSPATKAETGHDENIRHAQVQAVLGDELADELRRRSLALYEAGSTRAAEAGLIIADTKFEFGEAVDGRLLLIDEALTPDSSRFWPRDSYVPGRSQPSFDKQPLRDWLAIERDQGRWNGESPAPALPDEVVHAMSERYLAAFRRLTGRDLDIRGP